MIKLFAPEFGKEELKAVEKVFKSGILTQGPKVAELEKKFAKYVGSKYAVAVNSCTAGIFLCLQYEKQFKGLKRVSIPSVTYMSVANAIINSGLELEFNEEVYVGEPYRLYGTHIVDSAHHIERNCYQTGWLTCFSFYPTKLLGSCEGGMIALDDEDAYKWLRLARANGMERKGMFDWDYSVDMVGWRMAMNDVQAAIILERLKKLGNFNRKRGKVRDYYNKHLKLKNTSLHIYPIFIEERNRFIEDMKKVGIQCVVNFKPIHLQPAYRFMTSSLPYSEYWGQHEVSIPIHENMSLVDAKYVVKQIQKWK